MSLSSKDFKKAVKEGRGRGRPRKFVQVPVEEYEEMKKKIETPPARISPLENPMPDKVFHQVRELQGQVEALKEVLLWTLIALTGEGHRPPNVEKPLQKLGLLDKFLEKTR